MPGKKCEKIKTIVLPNSLSKSKTGLSLQVNILAFDLPTSTQNLVNFFNYELSPEGTKIPGCAGEEGDHQNDSALSWAALKSILIFH